MIGGTGALAEAQLLGCAVSCPDAPGVADDIGVANTGGGGASAVKHDDIGVAETSGEGALGVPSQLGGDCSACTGEALGGVGGVGGLA